MRNNTYNNLGFGIISIASVLNIIKSLSVDKVFLIILIIYWLFYNLLKNNKNSYFLSANKEALTNFY